MLVFFINNIRLLHCQAFHELTSMLNEFNCILPDQIFLGIYLMHVISQK
jgi:hypothetical protein